MKQQIAQPKDIRIAGFTITALFLFLAPLKAQQNNGWESSTPYDNGLKSDPVVANKYEFDKTLNGGKLVLLDFFTTWCGPCAKRAPQVEELKSAFADSLIVIKIDAEKFPDIAEQFDITQYPTFVYVHRGAELQRDVITPEAVRELLSLIAEIESSTWEFDEDMYGGGGGGIGLGGFGGQDADCYYFNFGNAIFVTYDDQTAENFAQLLGLITWGKGKNQIGEYYWVPPQKGVPVVQASPEGFVGSDGKIYRNKSACSGIDTKPWIDPEQFGRYGPDKGGALKLVRL